MIPSRRFPTNFNKKILSEFWYEGSKRYLPLNKVQLHFATICIDAFLRKSHYQARH